MVVTKDTRRSFHILGAAIGVPIATSAGRCQVGVLLIVVSVDLTIGTAVIHTRDGSVCSMRTHRLERRILGEVGLVEVVGHCARGGLGGDSPGVSSRIYGSKPPMSQFDAEQD